ncbi:Protein of unknown function [Micromonospora lupini str. Lupac 08]|uniref:Uncharacterized protein n=1 Tax=Micromonospora lupini str. Lupac 08 TaxID=1150864 RepID=I0KYU6_9ACTN|nr:Protein of unknown function [Micromonospora lupini str. Lupac 08]
MLRTRLPPLPVRGRLTPRILLTDRYRGRSSGGMGPFRAHQLYRSLYCVTGRSLQCAC